MLVDTLLVVADNELVTTIKCERIKQLNLLTIRQFDIIYKHVIIQVSKYTCNFPLLNTKLFSTGPIIKQSISILEKDIIFNINIHVHNNNYYCWTDL